ncbi:MAG: hypothetical protein IPM54_42955 [Polyangiaceae bacterium]|nr:hypothetical protein [Polyangiaceae bacterium]
METLAERIAREGPVNELDAVGWIVRLAKKLETLHARGLAHGGISPEALKTASTSRLSLGMLVPTGAVRNRMEFRSPERIDTEAASAADDTWSTAATLYALLTGASPFVAADDAAIQHKIRTGTFAPLSQFDVGDDDLQHVIESALSPSFANRTSTMAAFREALEAWHPDPKVRDLPPVADDQPDDDEDERTVMRPVSAADAVRAIMVQREQTTRAAEPAPSAQAAARRAATPAVPAHQPPPVAHAHGLMEDDDENAKTSLISVPPMAMFGSRAPATVPAPAPPGAGIRSAPPIPPTSAAGFSLQHAPGAPAARKSLAKQTMVGGFGAKPPAQPAPPVAPPAAALPPPPPVRPPSISREALLDDGDNEATVMREAPLEVMRQAKSSIAPPAPDRTTPVDPTSAAVAAATASSDIPPAAAHDAAAALTASQGSAPVIAMPSLFDDEPTFDKKGADARQTPASPSQGPSLDAPVDGAPKATPAAAEAIPPAPPMASPAARTAPSTPGMAAPALASLTAPSTPGMAAPPAARQPDPRSFMPTVVLPDPPAPPNAAQPNPLKGLLIGVGIALLIIAAVAGVYFFVLKR